MITNAKVQTNEYKVNVLVETQTSSNRHYCHLNRDVSLMEVLTDDSIIELWEKREENDRLALAKAWIKKQDGYAISNCVDESLNITYNSIITYK